VYRQAVDGLGLPVDGVGLPSLPVDGVGLPRLPVDGVNVRRLPVDGGQRAPPRPGPRPVLAVATAWMMTARYGVLRRDGRYPVPCGAG
jgi:hypothetical protein